MEPHAFSHNDEQYRITAEPGHYLKLYSVNPDKTFPDFVPPMENCYDQILRVKFGLDQSAFQKLRNDQLSSWKITEVIFYDAALSIRHENVFNKPILKDPGVRTRHGVRAEQIFTETIPYYNISATDFAIKIKLITPSGETKASWRTTIDKKKVTILTPGQMNYEIARQPL